MKSVGYMGRPGIGSFTEFPKLGQSQGNVAPPAVCGNRVRKGRTCTFEGPGHDPQRNLPPRAEEKALGIGTQFQHSELPRKVICAHEQDCRFFTWRVSGFLVDACSQYGTSRKQPLTRGNYSVNVHAASPKWQRSQRLPGRGGPRTADPRRSNPSGIDKEVLYVGSDS